MEFPLRRAFIEKHNKSGQYIQTDTLWLFWPDGAKCECEPAGVQAEPDPNPYQRAKDIVTYWKFRVRYLKRDYDNQTSELRMMADAVERDGCAAITRRHLDEGYKTLRKQRHPLRCAINSLNDALAEMNKLSPQKVHPAAVRRAEQNAEGKATARRVMSNLDRLKELPKVPIEADAMTS